MVWVCKEATSELYKKEKLYSIGSRAHAARRGGTRLGLHARDTEAAASATL